MAAYGDGAESGLVHEKLKDQVAVSIKESLEKATAVLSGLHRLQSYLDVFKSMSSHHRGGQHVSEGLRNSLEQIRTVRNDTATLLQTVYLTEIGLQSLNDSKGSSGGEASAPGGNVLASIMPMIGGPIAGDSGLSDLSEGAGGPEEGVMSMQLEGAEKEMDFESSSPNIEGIPPAKRINLGVTIATCTNCSKKFAAQRSENQGSLLCKSCHENVLPHSATSIAVTTPVHTSTPAKPTKQLTPGKRSNLPPLLCKLCGVCFHYRRCLLRHLRENHDNVDVNNLATYIEVGSVATHDKGSNDGDMDIPAERSQTSSLNVTVGTDLMEQLDEITESENNSAILPEPRQEGAHGTDEIGIFEGTGSVMASPRTSATHKNSRSFLKDKYVCNVCTKVFDRPYRLQRHMQIHNPNRPRVSCHLCDRTFTRYDTLEGHIKSSHSEDRPFQCTHKGCTKSFPTQSALTHHIRAHMDGKPYQCRECSSSFALLGQYKQHVRDLHPEMYNLQCYECFRTFPDNQSLAKHKQEQHRVECEICGKTFARIGYLQFHAELHNGSSLFNCRYCNEGFDTEHSYKIHVKVHPEAHRTRKLYQCQLCEVSFHQADGLVGHYRTQEHRDKANALGVSGTMLNTVETDISDMHALVDEVAMGAGENSSEDEEEDIIRSISISEAFQSPSVNSLVSNQSEGTFQNVSVD